MNHQMQAATSTAAPASIRTLPNFLKSTAASAIQRLWRNKVPAGQRPPSFAQGFLHG